MSPILLGILFGVIVTVGALVTVAVAAVIDAIRCRNFDPDDTRSALDASGRVPRSGWRGW